LGERVLLGIASNPGLASNGVFCVNQSVKLRPGSAFAGGKEYTRRLSELGIALADPDRAINRKHNRGGLALVVSRNWWKFSRLA
jgi:hypothetical protein